LSAANHPTTGCETTAIDIPNPEAVQGKIATHKFVDGLLNNTVSSSDYTVLNVKMMHNLGSAWKS